MFDVVATFTLHFSTLSNDAVHRPCGASTYKMFAIIITKSFVFHRAERIFHITCACKSERTTWICATATIFHFTLQLTMPQYDIFIVYILLNFQVANSICFLFLIFYTYFSYDYIYDTTQDLIQLDWPHHTHDINIITII